MACVKSRMSYLEPWSKEKENPYVRGAPDDGFTTCNYTNLEYPVKITDARLKKYEYSMDMHGFAYYDADITEETFEQLRTNDKARVTKEYYPMVEGLIKIKRAPSRLSSSTTPSDGRDPSLDLDDNSNRKEQPASLVSLAEHRGFAILLS